MVTTESINLVVRVTRRLFIALLTLSAAALALATLIPESRFVVPVVIIATGLIGGFVGLQRRLKDLTVSDLELIAHSWIYTWLSPMVGGILAVILYVLFLSELLTGQLFPHFVPDSPAQTDAGFSSLFMQHAENYQEYAKLVFWSFVAGFSERFVTDVISRFQGTAIKDLPQSSDAVPSVGPANTRKDQGPLQ